MVGFGPGAVADVILRVMAARMSQSLGQQLVVENRPGAGSSLGAEYVARAPKDGYTLLMCTVAQTINPAMNNLSFDFGKDLAPIALGRQRAADAGGASVAAGEQRAAS